jgi:calcium-dependent protein kinase
MLWLALQVLELVGDHLNIAALKSAFEDRDYVYFILELCKGGELFDRIVAEVSIAGWTPC